MKTFLNLVQKQLNNCFTHSNIPNTMRQVLLQPTNEIIFKRWDNRNVQRLSYPT